MTRFIAVFHSNIGAPFAMGPYSSRRAAALYAAEARSRNLDLQADVIEIRDREIETGHVPIGIDANGNGPVEDALAVGWVCLECGCPAIKPPSVPMLTAMQRLAKDLRDAQSELPEILRWQREQP